LFVKEMLNDNPRANARDVNQAWPAAGRPGRISAGLVNHLGFRMGLSGNPHGRKATGAKRGRPPVQVQPGANGSTPATKRRRSSALMGLKVEIDRLLRKVVEIGQFLDVEDGLRSARRRPYAGMSPGSEWIRTSRTGSHFWAAR
jgi:hypothetical protein